MHKVDYRPVKLVLSGLGWLIFGPILGVILIAAGGPFGILVGGIMLIGGPCVAGQRILIWLRSLPALEFRPQMLRVTTARGTKDIAWGSIVGVQRVHTVQRSAYGLIKTKTNFRLQIEWMTPAGSKKKVSVQEALLDLPESQMDALAAMIAATSQGAMADNGASRPARPMATSDAELWQGGRPTYHTAPAAAMTRTPEPYSPTPHYAAPQAPEPRVAAARAPQRAPAELPPPVAMRGGFGRKGL